MNRITVRTATRILEERALGFGLFCTCWRDLQTGIARDFTPISQAGSVLVKNELNGKFIVQENVYFDIYDEWGRKVATICVPKDFETDFGSIPQICRGVIEGIGTPRDLIYLLHDWLYATEFFAWEGVTYEWLPGASENRAMCDELLLMGCKQVGDSWLTRNTIWSQVRLWGYWAAWSKHTPGSIAFNRGLLTAATNNPLP